MMVVVMMMLMWTDVLAVAGYDSGGGGERVEVAAINAAVALVICGTGDIHHGLCVGGDSGSVIV